MALLYIQCDWNEALQDEEGKAWITFKARGQKGIRAFLKQMPQSDDSNVPFIISTSQDFEIQKVRKESLIIKPKAQGRVYKLVAPYRTFNSIHTKSISCLDVSHGGLGVSAGDEGMFVWETENGLIRRKLDGGHVGDIYSVQLFPSGIVVLSSGADMRAKIWSAEDGSCPVTLVGHSGAVTQTAIVDRGRNVVTVSKDSNIRLWSCGEKRSIDPVIEINDCINCIDILETDSNVIGHEEMETNEDDVEVGTSGKVLVVGTENGGVHLVDLRGRKVIKSLKLHSAVNAVKFHKESGNVFMAGTQDGEIVVISFPEMKILFKIHDSDSSVESLLSLRNGIVCGKYDGACVWYGFSDDFSCPLDQVIVLTGADVDPVTDLAQDQDYVYTSCRDGCIRKYCKLEMFSS